jgi:hypothetical protein
MMGSRALLRGVGYAACVAVLTVAVILEAGVGWAQNFGAPLERFVRLEWEPGTTRSGRPTVIGTVYNDHPGLWLVNVRLLVEELDTSGQPVGRTIGYVNDEVPPKRRGYFEVRTPATGAAYRVTLLHFELARRTGP